MARDLVRVNTNELAPTQPTIGRFEVLLKSDRFKLMGPRALDGYLEEKRSKGKAVQVVKGLHRYYVVDGHHTLTAMLAGDAPPELDLDLRADHSGMGPDAFWQRMLDDGLVHTRALGAPVEVSQLPSSFDRLVDDPFRSIAWLIRKMGAFEDLKRPYQEFAVADFLREHMHFAPTRNYEYEIASLRAFELMRSSLAEERAHADGRLGFLGGDVDRDTLIDDYYQVLEEARAPRWYRNR
ncbi:MAG: ParB/Srx family N-terminal domain-containing protein [Myxococcota bacterium]